MKVEIYGRIIVEVIEFSEDFDSCKDCYFSQFDSKVCENIYCTEKERKDKKSVIFRRLLKNEALQWVENIYDE